MEMSIPLKNTQTSFKCLNFKMLLNFYSLLHQNDMDNC